MKSLLRTDLLFLIAVGLSFSNAQVNFTGPCPDLPVAQPFSIDKYLGRWYEVEKYPTSFEKGGKCIYADYTPGDNGTIRVRNVRIIASTGKFSESFGTARQTEPENNNGKLAVKFDNRTREGAYWVMKTDYNQYSVVWSCRQYDDETHGQYLFFLSHVRDPPADTRTQVRAFMAELNLDTTKLEPTDQKDCPEPRDSDPDASSSSSRLSFVPLYMMVAGLVLL